MEMSHPHALGDAVADADLFDPAVALERTCDDLELLAELAELFAENRDRLLADLAAAIERRDARGVDQAAHALKGSVGTFTVLRPYRLARELEFCGKEKRLEAAPQLLDALKTSLADLQSAVASFLNSQR
jgi:HPt (histidine-containing phosphotransfer) domain-containing protein